MSDAPGSRQTIDNMQILQALPDAVFVVDQQSRVVLWNGMAEQVSGYRADELLGRKCPESLLQDVTECAPNACNDAGSARVCLNDGQRREMVTYIRHRDGHLVPVLVKLSPVFEDKTVVATIAEFSDMTPRAMQEPRVPSAPEPGDWVDAVTLLPSKMASAAQVRESFERWKLTGERFSMILILAADAQVVERQHGANLKTRLFAELGKTLGGAVRQNDFVGRWMEDQFIVILPHCALRQGRQAGRRLLYLLQQTAVCDQGQYITAQVQCAVASIRASDTPPKLLERAYQELKHKHSIEHAASGRTPIPFHQQRPM